MTQASRSKLTWLGHSTVRIDLPGGEVAVIDPWLTGNPSAPAGYEFERLDLVLLTHAHGDHMGDAIPLATKHDALLIATYDLATWIGSQGVKRVSGMNLGGTQIQSGCEISQVRADHSSSFEDSKGRPLYGGVATGFMVKLPDGPTVYHAGDTALFSDMALLGELYRPDFACLPIGGHFTMGPDHAARAAKLLGVKRVLPIHWSTFGLLAGTPDQLATALAAHAVDAEVLRLAPGGSCEL